MSKICIFKTGRVLGRIGIFLSTVITFICLPFNFMHYAYKDNREVHSARSTNRVRTYWTYYTCNCIERLGVDSFAFVIKSRVLGVGRDMPIRSWCMFLSFALSYPSSFFFLLFLTHSENPIQSLNSYHVFISFCVCFYCNRAWQNHYVIGLVCSCQSKHTPSAAVQWLSWAVHSER